MTISAIMIADSISPQGKRLRTFQLRYPRFIHAEFMTHRVFSRNASSSRAVPVKKLIQDIHDDPVAPSYWGANQKGMQAKEELTGEFLARAIWEWGEARDAAIASAEILDECGAHKQIVNRILEPFSHINVVCTATEYENFYALRRHADAQPEIKALADAMWEAEQKSNSTAMQPGDWHLPYVKTKDWVTARNLCKYNHVTRDEPAYWEMRDILLKVSVARCARVSYLTHDGRETTVEEDAALYDRLVGSMPLHASPAEHQATPDSVIPLNGTEQLNGVCPWNNPHQHGNLCGWRQHRKLLPGEFTPG